jgi:glutaredoxin 3
MPKVEVYTKDYCPYCVKAMNLLHQKGVAFTEIDVTHDEAEFTKMLERAKPRRTVPQIFINNVAIGGCDDLYALEAASQLDPMLAE